MARESKRQASGIQWRLWLGLTAGVLVFAGMAWAASKIRHYALTSPNFQLSRSLPDSIAVHGLAHASRVRVQSVFATDFDRSVFAVPLAERRRRLLGIDWVESASVSRILPRRLVVQIRERKPVAFCVLRGHVFLLDAFGVLLEQTPQAKFVLPVLQGVEPNEPESVRRERVQAMLEVLKGLDSHASEISEINAADTSNIRVTAKIEGRAVELILGDGDYGRRYQNFLNNYPEIRKRSPAVKIFDLRLDDRITVKE